MLNSLARDLWTAGAMYFKIRGETESWPDGFEIFIICSWSSTSLSKILNISIVCNGGSSPISALFSGTVIEEIFVKKYLMH